MNCYCLPPFLFFFFLFSLENIITSLYILVIYLCNCHSQYLASQQQILSHQYYSDIFLGAAILMELLLFCAFEASKLVCTKFHFCLLIFFDSKKREDKKSTNYFGTQFQALVSISVYAPLIKDLIHNLRGGVGNYDSFYKP